MKCACGNEQAGPLVNPAKFTTADGKVLLYMAGMSSDGQCWFCCTPGTPVSLLSDEQRAKVLGSYELR